MWVWSGASRTAKWKRRLASSSAVTSPRSTAASQSLGGQVDPLVGVGVELRQGPARRPTLDQPAQVVDLVQVVEVELGDEVAAPRPVGELTLLLEHRQRFAHRRQADPEPLGDLLLAHPVAWFQLARDEGVAEAFDRMLGGRPQPRIFEIRWDSGEAGGAVRTAERSLISFGGLLADLVVSVDAVPERGADTLARDFSQTVGGGFAVIAAAARLGMPTAFAGVLGERRDRRRGAGASSREEGIEMLFPEPRAGGSGVCLVLVDAGGERTMVTVQGVESRIQSEDFDAVAPNPGDVVYLNGYELLYPHATGLVNWVRRVRPGSPRLRPRPADFENRSRRARRRSSRATAVAEPQRAEAAALTGEDDPAAAAVAALPESARMPDLTGRTVDGPKTQLHA